MAGYSESGSADAISALPIRAAIDDNHFLARRAMTGARPLPFAQLMDHRRADHDLRMIAEERAMLFWQLDHRNRSSPSSSA